MKIQTNYNNIYNYPKYQYNRANIVTGSNVNFEGIRLDKIIQTKAQKVTLSLDKDSTAGYIIKELESPKEFEVGQKIKLSLGVISEEYSLYDKIITVTYNGEILKVDENDFSFEILPLKGIENIKVVVANKPQA